MMQSSRQQGGTPDLRWIHPDPAVRYHELRSPQGKVASIRWRNQTGTLATGEWGEHSWTFKRFGFFHPKMTIRRPGSEANVAGFEPNMSGGGMLHLEDGINYRLVGNFWRAEWRWVSGGGRDGLEFRRDFAVEERNEGHITWIADDLREETLHLLALFGWYVVIMLAEDAAGPVV